MTKKDYIIIASILKIQMQEAENFDQKSGIQRVIGGFCYELAQDNPRFNEQKFLDAIYK